MMTVHQQQPKRSKSCGQHCVAMLAGIDVSEVIAQYGSAGTKPSQILEIARRFGLKQKTRLWQLTQDGQSLPVFGLLKLRKPRRKNYHWACVINGVIHDPACAVAGVHASRHHIACWIEFTK